MQHVAEDGSTTRRWKLGDHCTSSSSDGEYAYAYTTKLGRVAREFYRGGSFSQRKHREIRFDHLGTAAVSRVSALERVASCCKEVKSTGKRTNLFIPPLIAERCTRADAIFKSRGSPPRGGDFFSVIVFSRRLVSRRYCS